MECDVCMQHFDSAERRPKVLLCGHTYCLSCLRQLATKKCPVDEKAFQLDALADNFKLLSATHRPTRFWCVSCEKEATEHCVSEHDLRSLKKQRTAAAEHHLEALQQGEEALAALAGMLDEATVIRQMEDCSDTLQRERASLAAARAAVRGALGDNAAAWEQAKQAAVQSVLSRSAAQVAADLSSASSWCSLTVHRGAGGDAAWTGVVRPARDPVARLLLCRLACGGRLWPPQHEPEQPQDLHEEQQNVDVATSSNAAAQSWEERSNQAELSVEDMVQRVGHGSRVARGRDWKVVKHGNQDGTPPGPGTVTAVVHGDPIGKGVQVTWDRTGKVHWYSMGCRTRKCELRLLPPELCVRTLLGLHCDVDPGWSLTVLQQAAPRLKALQLVSPQQQHLDAALAMPLLEGLCVCNVTGPQLQQVVRMASLRRLELHCPPDAALPDIFTFPGAAAGLRWLRSGLYPLVTALALVRAHADTLEELQLVAASTEPYGCPNLARELQRCGLKKLKKMLLLRRDAYDAFCRHDQNTCREQLSQILHIFSERGLSVAVLCSECNLNSEII